MSNQLTMANKITVIDKTKVPDKPAAAFERQLFGYDKTQVDGYVISVIQAYQTVYDEYFAVCGKYNDLLKKYKDMQSADKNKPNPDIIAKTLINTELFAEKIIHDADLEAAKLREEAHEEAQSIIRDAHAETALIKMRAVKFLEGINADSPGPRKKAYINSRRRQFLTMKRRPNKSSADRVRAMNERELANEAISRLLGEIEDLKAADRADRSILYMNKRQSESGTESA